jgi:hypothetical protein
MTDHDQEQFETLLENTDNYAKGMYQAFVLAIEKNHMDVKAALTTAITVAAKVSEILPNGVDEFEKQALDYIDFARNAKSGNASRRLQ